jgi:hypothetical protein
MLDGMILSGPQRERLFAIAPGRLLIIPIFSAIIGAVQITKLMTIF